MSDLTCNIELEAPLEVNIELNAVGTTSYTLPAATAIVRGGITVGARLTMTGDTLSADVQGSSYTLPVATGSVLGGVKDGDRITIGVDGTISADVQTTDISGKVDKVTGSSLVADTEIAKIHSQGTDQGLDTGGANAVTAAQVKSAVTNSHASGSDNQDLSGLVIAPAANTADYIPQWNGANSKTLKDGLAVPAGGLAGLTALGDKLASSAFSDAGVTGKLITGYTSGAGTVAGTDTILQAINKLNGNDALKLPLAGGTMVGNLIFTDNTYDIGASAATRPRTGYFGTSLLAPNIYGGVAQTIALTIQGNSATASGTNIAGGDVYIKATPGTGTGASSIHFYTGRTLTTGTTLQTLTEAVTILGNGSVGIGTTDTTVVGGATYKTLITNSVAGQDAFGIRDTSSATGYSNFHLIGTGRTYQIGVGNASETSFGIPNKYFVYDRNATAMRLVIDTTGNVGIGTTAPGNKLQVAGTIMSMTSGGGGAFWSKDYGLSSSPVVNDLLGYFGFSGENTAPAMFSTAARIDGIVDATGGTRVKAAIVFNTSDGTNVVERARISSSGNVGIGTTSPTARLQLPAATAAANTASLKIDPGVVATTPVSGNIESDGTHLYWTDSGGTRRTLDNVI